MDKKRAVAETVSSVICAKGEMYRRIAGENNGKSLIDIFWRRNKTTWIEVNIDNKGESNG